MNETDAIRQRHSVRQYKPDRIEDKHPNGSTKVLKWLF